MIAAPVTLANRPVRPAAAKAAGDGASSGDAVAAQHQAFDLAQAEAAPSSPQAAATGNVGGAAGDSGKNLLNMDIDQLAKTPVVVPSMDMPVTSVTKEQSTVGRSAAAVFVIWRVLPEALS